MPTYSIRSGLVVALLCGFLSEPCEARSIPGEQLMATLGCPGCHKDLEVGTRISSQAPSLQDAGLRWKSDYLFEYLRTPQAVRRNLGAARMPDFHLSEREALALTLYLGEQKDSPEAIADLPGALDLPIPHTERITSDKELREVFQEQDCLACHGADAKGGSLGPDLANAGARLQPEWIRRFLASPSAWGIPDGVMPALFLRRQEDGRLQAVRPDSLLQLRRVTEYLERTGRKAGQAREDSFEKVRARHPGVTANEGRRVFDALACRACHRFDRETFVEPAPDLRIEKTRVRKQWLRDYLAAPHAIRPFGSRPGNGARMPDFDLNEAEVQELSSALLDAEPQPPGLPTSELTAHQRGKARRILHEQLSCLGCHQLEGRGGRIGPDLTLASTRLQPSFLQSMLADPRGTVPHTTMPQPRLDEKTRELVAAYLLEPRPGAPGEYLSLIENATIALPSAHGPAHDYALYCASCHGPDGRGDGFNAPFLAASPLAHADPAAVGMRADDTLFDGIHGGGAILDRSPLMPAWGGTLSNERISLLVGYLRTLCQCAGPPWSTDPTATAASDPGRAERNPTPQITRVPQQPPPTLEAFVGAQACAECHPGPYEAWQGSTHGNAGGRPDETQIIAAFDGKPRRLRDGIVRPKRTENGRYVFQVSEDGGDKTEIEVAAVVGGGHLLGGGTQAFFTEMADGSLRMLPFDFHRQEDTWFVQLRDSGHWTPIGEHIGLNELEHWPPYRALGSAPRLSHCENCHGSQLQVEFDRETNTYETRWKSLRIDCESCHGPGQAHLAWARSTNRDIRSDIGMDSLELLDKRQSVEVCLRCHANKQVLSPDYLPGADLETHLALKLPILAQQPYLVDGRIDGFGYQQNHLFSDCYVEGSMVCTDCHDPHTQTYRDIHGNVLSSPFDDQQCTGCHPSKAIDPGAHTHHEPDSAASRCTSCHMPYLQHQSIGNELRFARSDHTIPIPRPEFDAAIGIENACAKCHPKTTTAELQSQVDAWWGPIKPHHPMIARLLAGETTQDPTEAAKLLLAPAENHPIAQFAGLSTYVRDHVRADQPLAPEARKRLRALKENEDLDIASLAYLALHVASPGPPDPAALPTPSQRGQDGESLAWKRRWQQGLLDLQRLRRAQGNDAEASRLGDKRREVLQQLANPPAGGSPQHSGAPTAALTQ